MDNHINYSKIYEKYNVQLAWQRVKSNASVGGIDLVSINDFEKDLSKRIEEISSELQTETYNPNPYKSIEIAKNENEKRQIGLLTVKDKIVQSSVKQVIEPVFEQLFLDVSYAYRPNKSAEKAIRRTRHLIQSENRRWVVIMDIDNFFDTIPLAAMFEKLKYLIPDGKIRKLIELSIRMGSVNKGMEWTQRTCGLPQGGVLSPMLSNLYLHDLDVFVVLKKWGYIRYADDFIILCKTKQEAENAFAETRKFIETKLNLGINADFQIKHVASVFDFLGISFNDNGITISEKKMQKIKTKCETAFALVDNTIDKKYVETFDGIKRYYGRLLDENILENIDNMLLELYKKEFKKNYNNRKPTKSELKNWIEQCTFLSKASNNQIKQIKKTIYDLVINLPEKKATIDELIQKKKQEYQKLESAGNELIIKTAGVFLSKYKNNISVKQNGKILHKVNSLNLKNITIVSKGVALSSDVIKFCAERNISIDFLGFDGKPYAMIYAPQFAAAEPANEQISAIDNGKGFEMIKEIIAAKIKNQVSLIRYYAKYKLGKDPDFTEAFEQQTLKMEKLIEDLKMLKNDDKFKGKVFSIEGRAAASYWDMMERMLNDYIDFSGRVRQGATDMVNCMLNYGYGILYARIWEALISAKLNPYISYLHTTQQNDPALVFDFIEQFRQPCVDRAVFSIITKKEKIGMENNFIDNATKERVAEKVIERLNKVVKINGKEQRLVDVIKTKARELADFFVGKSKKFKPYISKW